MGIGETIGISIISASVVSFFAYYFGFRQYLKQKGREEIVNTYIKNGIDRIIEVMDKACFGCQFNFGKAMRIIEYLEKLPEGKEIEIEEKLVRGIFSEMKPIIVAPEIALYKLELLTGTHKVTSSWIISTIADYLRYNDYLRYEFLLETELYFRHPDRFGGEKKRFLEELEKRVVESYQGAISSHEPLKTHLLNLKIRIDEIGISTMKDLDKIPKDKRIKEILNEVKKDHKKIKIEK